MRDYSMSTDAERVLRSSVPDRHKSATSPIGAVQNYIADLEQRITELEGAIATVLHIDRNSQLSIKQAVPSEHAEAWDAAETVIRSIIQQQGNK